MTCWPLAPRSVRHLEQNILRALVSRRNLQRRQRLAPRLGLVADLEQAFGEIGVRRRTIERTAGKRHAKRANRFLRLAAGKREAAERRMRRRVERIDRDDALQRDLQEIFVL